MVHINHSILHAFIHVSWAPNERWWKDEYFTKVFAVVPDSVSQKNVSVWLQVCLIGHYVTESSRFHFRAFVSCMRLQEVDWKEFFRDEEDWNCHRELWRGRRRIAYRTEVSCWRAKEFQSDIRRHRREKGVVIGMRLRTCMSLWSSAYYCPCTAVWCLVYCAVAHK